MRMRKIAILNFKGGTGKTTTAVDSKIGLWATSLAYVVNCFEGLAG